MSLAQAVRTSCIHQSSPTSPSSSKLPRRPQTCYGSSTESSGIKRFASSAQRAPRSFAPLFSPPTSPFTATENSKAQRSSAGQGEEHEDSPLSSVPDEDSPRLERSDDQLRSAQTIAPRSPHKVLPSSPPPTSSPAPSSPLSSIFDEDSPPRVKRRRTGGTSFGPVHSSASRLAESESPNTAFGSSSIGRSHFPSSCSKQAAEDSERIRSEDASPSLQRSQRVLGQRARANDASKLVVLDQSPCEGVACRKKGGDDEEETVRIGVGTIVIGRDSRRASVDEQHSDNSAQQPSAEAVRKALPVGPRRSSRLLRRTSNPFAKEENSDLDERGKTPPPSFDALSELLTASQSRPDPPKDHPGRSLRHARERPAADPVLQRRDGTLAQVSPGRRTRASRTSDEETRSEEQSSSEDVVFEMLHGYPREKRSKRRGRDRSVTSDLQFDEEMEAFFNDKTRCSKTSDSKAGPLNSQKAPPAGSTAAVAGALSEFEDRGSNVSSEGTSSRRSPRLAQKYRLTIRPLPEDSGFLARKREEGSPTRELKCFKPKQPKTSRVQDVVMDAFRRERLRGSIRDGQERIRVVLRKELERARISDEATKRAWAALERALKREVALEAEERTRKEEEQRRELAWAKLHKAQEAKVAEAAAKRRARVAEMKAAKERERAKREEEEKMKEAEREQAWEARQRDIEARRRKQQQQEEARSGGATQRRVKP